MWGKSFQPPPFFNQSALAYPPVRSRWLRRTPAVAPRLVTADAGSADRDLRFGCAPVGNRVRFLPTRSVAPTNRLAALVPHGGRFGALSQATRAAGERHQFRYKPQYASIRRSAARGAGTRDNRTQTRRELMWSALGPILLALVPAAAEALSCLPPNPARELDARLRQGGNPQVLIGELTPPLITRMAATASRVGFSGAESRSIGYPRASTSRPAASPSGAESCRAARSTACSSSTEAPAD